MNTLSKSLVSGLAGATALTLLHETARRALPDAPRMDLLGMRAIAKNYQATNQTPPPNKQLHTMALAGDLVSNSLYYSLVGTGKGAWVRGAALGLAAGIGGVLLPGPLGLGADASARTPQTVIMTAAWYLLGGLTAAAVAQAFGGRRK